MSWANFGVTDVDTPAASLSIRVTGLPADGLLQTYNGTSWVNVTANQVITKATIDAGSFRFVPDSNESGSDAGAAAFARLDDRSAELIRGLLTPLGSADRERLISSMATIERLLGGRPAGEGRPSFTLRPHRPGDLGWVVQRHGELYSELRGWDDGFEAMCAEIAARFLRDFDASQERSWIAEIDGARVGAVFLVRKSKTVGQLRMLFVDPAARGLGIGARLVSECVGHARHVGYRKMTLFTVAGLDSARRLYEAEGFVLAHEEREQRWGGEQTAQRWDLTL
jgi:GNAT superfamily N-acetyltransferase